MNFNVILQKYFVFFCIAISLKFSWRLLLGSLIPRLFFWQYSFSHWPLYVIICGHLCPVGSLQTEIPAPLLLWVQAGTLASGGSLTLPLPARGDLPCPASFLLGSPALSYPWYSQASRCKVWSSLGRTEGNRTNFASYQYSIFSTAPTIIFSSQSSQATFLTVHTHTQTWLISTWGVRV